ncbi:MAG: glycosyltransferase family 2 protein [Oceanospirillaceae bacterium]|nr:glycosyltransferase family 2 protein [Oceanospirillaceae bacterium]
MTIIIVSYNSAAVIIDCLSGLIEALPHQIRVVDNASRPGDVELLEKRFPQLEIMRLDHNLGYGRAANVALNAVQSRYALLINPDILVDAPRLAELLQQAASYPEAAIFGPATSRKHRQIVESAEEKEAISGSCMLFDMEKLRPLGGFDENIFLFSEEVDLCWRAREAGHKVLLLPRIYVEHLAGRSSGSSDAVEYMKNWHFGWSRSYFYRKHSRDRGKHALRRRFWLYSWKALIARRHYDKVKFRAIRDGIRAFQAGEAAFLADGRTPQASPDSPENPYAGS